MALHTRRKILQAVTALTAGLAGCNGLSGSSSSSATAVAGRSDPPANSETDPPQLLVRAGTERPPLRLAEPDSETADEDWNKLDRRITHEVISTPETAERLTIAAGVETDADIESFVSETAFDSETLFLETTMVQECFRLDLCWVSWGAEEIGTDYARILRDYDEACSDDTTVMESRLIRLPVALDEESVHSFGTTIGSGSCDRGGEE